MFHDASASIVVDRCASSQVSLLRRAVLAIFVTALLVLAGGEGAVGATFANPIVAAAATTGSADPSVVLHRGYYYYCRSLADGAIGVARARRLQDIGAAQLAVVFRPPAESAYSRELWAPELQRLRGRWYIYFAASDGVNANHRMYALEAQRDDPQGPYSFKGRVAAWDDTWAIDGAVLELGKSLFFVWSGRPVAGADFPQALYLAAMSNLWTVVGERHLIAAPEHDWERSTAPLLEAPQPLRHNGKTFIVYSASASWSDDYALGLLTFVGSDPLRGDAWIKNPHPVFAKNVDAAVFGVGHPSFVPSPDRSEDWIMYHAMERAGAGWAGRSVRAQPFRWCADGRPGFSPAIAAGRLLVEPSGTPGLRSKDGTNSPRRRAVEACAN